MAHIGCETETELRPSNKSVKSWLTGHLGSAVAHGDVAHWHKRPFGKSLQRSLSR